MGRVTNPTPAAAAPPPSSPLMHFSHHHELHPLSLYNPQTLCSGCKLPSSGTMYACKPCSFTLHHSCAKLPQLITHPSHGGCTLSLLTTASYPGGIFSCDACSRFGDGWSYHCSRCEYDLHVTCASKPLKIRHQAHISCELELTFKNPYANSNGFSCDICRRIGSKQWLYRCNSCEFDVHLDCTAAAPPPVLQHHHSFPPAASLYNNQLTHSASTGGIMNIHSQFPAPPPPAAAPQVNGFVGPPQPHLMHSASTGGIGNPHGYGVNQFPGQVNAGQIPGSVLPGNQQITQPARGDGLGSNLMMAAMQGFVEGAFQGVGQTLVQEVIGGGGGGGGDAGDGSSY
ncbi:hypothetical protein Salat_0014000 [Sesamum alatum]|uniref:DC1 domain-containing protein n=1 Tax=Sesamum alatum TaxID=300844 RepID=A0AAE1YVZ9_9LAMI|nr:hypothetical protein Salat_0014000 [Sesamum alatum]